MVERKKDEILITVKSRHDNKSTSQRESRLRNGYRTPGDSEAGYLDNTNHESLLDSWVYSTCFLTWIRSLMLCPPPDNVNHKVVEEEEEEGDVWLKAQVSLARNICHSFPRRSANRNTPLPYASEAPRPRKAATHAHHPQLQSNLLFGCIIRLPTTTKSPPFPPVSNLPSTENTEPL